MFSKVGTQEYKTTMQNAADELVVELKAARATRTQSRQPYRDVISGSGYGMGR